MTRQHPRRLGLAASCLLCGGLQLLAQDGKSPAELQSQLDNMQRRLQSAQQQIDQDHMELQQLRIQLQALQVQIAPATELQQAVDGLKEQQGIQQSEIQVHEQAKVESASKYQVKLHGLLLFNAAVTNGAVDQPRLPIVAIASGGPAANGSLTASGRQTLLGLEATGPTLWGARTYGNIEMDFSAGLSPGAYGGDPLFRLRTAGMQMVWPSTTIEAGISPLILTPEYATSYFSIAQPALSWSGALWSWLPQLSVERRWALSDHQQLSLQGALADVPDAGLNAVSGLGAVSAGERSRYPGSEARAAWHRGSGETIGIGGYFSPHNYSGSGTIDAWAGTVDWKTMVAPRWQLSGEVYRGSSLGGLGAGAFKDNIMVYGESSLVAEKNAGLRDAGGWAQLKFKPLDQLEFNLAFGLDNADSTQLRNADIDTSDAYSQLARNQTGFANIIFRPTSTLILSGEYRRINSWEITGPAAHASRFGLAAGYAF